MFSSLPWEDLQRLAALSDYNTRVVLLGALMLGLVAGAVGSFMVLRKRAMISDVVSHAALPGIVAAFMLATVFGGDGKHGITLLAGALVSGLLGMAAVHGMTAHARIKQDAALGVVLSVFFGTGVVLLGFTQRMTSGSAAGLESFIYGKTASMLAADAWLLSGAALGAATVCLLFFKELRLVCFDAEFARAQGWPVRRIDALLTGLVVVVTVIGLQAVGLILMIALLITPAVTARFWTDRLGAMVVIAALVGGVACVAGAALSALYPRIPAGSMIVLACSSMFAVSLAVGRRRGLLPEAMRRMRLSSRMERHHLLRSLYERWEQHAGAERQHPGVVLVPAGDLALMRRWTESRLQRVLRAAAADGEVELDAWPLVRLTASGLRHARQVVRNHRLWEWYLIQHAEVDPHHVDRDADEIEHVLGADMVRELEATLPRAVSGPELPASPHPLNASVPATGGGGAP